MKILNDLDLKEKKIFFIIVIAFLFFYILRLFLDIYLYIDSYEYLDVATALKEKQYFNYYGLREKDFTRRPIFYPLFLSLLLNLKYSAIAFIQMIIVIFSIYNLFVIAKKTAIPIDKKMALFIILTPTIFYYSHAILAEWMVFCLLNLLLYLFTLNWSNKTFLAIQVITLLLAFIKPVFYPFIYINFIFFSIFFIRKKKISIWLFLPITVLHLFLNFNEQKTGAKHFSSIENVNLCYNVFVYKKNTISNDAAVKWFSNTIKEAKKETTFKDETIFLRNKGLEEIKKDWFNYSFFHAYRGIKGIIDPGFFDFASFYKSDNERIQYSNNEGIQYVKDVLSLRLTFSQIINSKFFIYLILLIPIIFINIVKYFFFCWSVFKTKHSLFSVYMILIIVYYIFISGTVNSSRYMMPLQGIIILFSLLGFENFINRKKIKAHAI